MLDLSPLALAIKALEKSWAVVSRMESTAQSDSDLLDTLHSGVIQNFEVCYELSWKMIKRWLENNLSPDIADGISRRELFRHAHEQRLIDDVDLWMKFHFGRNQSSHVYSGETSIQVLQIAKEFPKHAQDLYIRITTRND